MPTFKPIPDADGDCPFCRGTFQAGYVDGVIPAVLHSQPHCGRFDELEPDAYLAAVNEEARVRMGALFEAHASRPPRGKA